MMQGELTKNKESLIFTLVGNALFKYNCTIKNIDYSSSIIYIDGSIKDKFKCVKGLIQILNETKDYEVIDVLTITVLNLIAEINNCKLTNINSFNRGAGIDGDEKDAFNCSIMIEDLLSEYVL